jgi:hypothetical protein
MKGEEQMRTVMRRIPVLAAALVLASTVPAAADSWNDRTTLSFTAPVMVPGATLPAGTYVFELMDSDSNRHLVRILSEDESKVIATTQAVPMKRQDPKGDVVLKLDPTEPGTPPALRAWFYPGSIYGHEFVYPEAQARDIAQRTKTLVLSIDQAGTDMEKGILRTYSPSGERVEWHGDAETLREWRDYQTSRSASRADTSREERREATAPAVQAAFEGMRVTVDQLEDDAQRYIGKQVSVDGEVDAVLGPRLFAIDEPRWGDLEGEILVYVPTGLAALVRDDDRVTVTGTVKPFVRADFEREWGAFPFLGPDIEVRISKRPVLMADRVVGGNNDVALVIDPAGKGRAEKQGSASGAAASGAQAAQRSGADAPGRGAPITELAKVATAADAAVGRRVHLSGVEVSATDSERGFFVDAGDRSLFVLPARANTVRAQEGETVTVRGVVLQMPGGMEDRLKAPGELNDDVYVLATGIERPGASS